MAHRSRFKLYFSVIVANIGAFSLGSLYNWSSPAITKLKAADSFLPINTTDISWIGSLISIGSIFGPFIGGLLVDSVGRKTSMIIAVTVGMVAWVILYFAKVVWLICISRVIGGLGGGIIFCSVPLYVCEIAEDDIRSALGSSMNFFFASGFLVEYIFGPHLSYWNLILVSCVTPLLFYIMCPFMPESPYYYVLKNDMKKAESALMSFRQGWDKKDIDKELEVIKEFVEDAMNQKGTLIELVSTKSNRRALFLSCGAMSFQQLSGINVVLFYTEMIFNSSGKIALSTSNCTILVALILIAFAGAAVPLVKRYGIKNMLIVSSIGMFFFQTVTGFYFFLHDKIGVDFASLRWLPVINLIGYVITYSLGFGPLPMAVKGEVFPANVKGISSAVTVGYSWSLSFIITRSFPHINEHLGMYTVFWIFSLSCFFAILFSTFFMIDTRNMSLQDIQDLLKNKKKTKDVIIMNEIPDRYTSNTTLA